MEKSAGTGQVLGAPAIGEETRSRWLPAPRGEKATQGDPAAESSPRRAKMPFISPKRGLFCYHRNSV